MRKYMKGNKSRLMYLQLVPVAVVVLVVIGLISYGFAHPPAIFSPAGPVAHKERNLIYFALGLSLIIVLPVFGMLFGFAWHYREGNHQATYSPKLDGSRRAETIWWTIPTLLILALSIVTWNSSHDLDPFRTLVSDKQPLQVQVVALDWKWLFIYPQQNVASVNELHIPTNVPVDFELTSDAPMNSFWIPRLGGQIYTMPGMMTQLHLLAAKDGSYRGQSANISGTGFAGMHFQAIASSQSSFNDWIASAYQSSEVLDSATYASLAKPSTNNRPAAYASVDQGLFNSVIAKYLPANGMNGMSMDMNMEMDQ